MIKARKFVAFVLVLVIATTVLVMPAAAAGYVPTCWACGKTYITPTGRYQTYDLGDGMTYIEYEYRCSRCGSATWIDASLLG